jgi:hypothetical protein
MVRKKPRIAFWFFAYKKILPKEYSEAVLYPIEVEKSSP